ncbi:MAG: aminoacyl-tRNA hydrolase [Tannerellaceae bacterium]|jgi:PTH1 family peptidyl-tRNA hydrolase|nr:aminoacyl-tRNA hydrolase [Tannerellaceae bacterium]
MKYLIVGLGNFPPEYWKTRHNIGFRVVEKLAADADIPFSSTRYGDMAQIRIKGRSLLLFKPTTFMNASGRAVRYWLGRENISDENLLIVADDIALPFGSLRLKARGSHGGHNGLRDIEEKLGTREYARLRFGVGNDFSRGAQADYVLSDFDDQEQATLPARLSQAAEAVRSFCLAGVDNTMNLYNNK